MRDVQRGIDDYLAATGDPRVVPIVNLQCDIDHPTQSLADLLWLHEHFGGRLAGRRITMSWAYSPSYAKPLSVPQGVVSLLTRFGAHVTLAHPPGLRPAAGADGSGHAAGATESGGSFRVTRRHGRCIRRRRSGVPQVVGASGADARTGRGEPRAVTPQR